MGRKIIDITGLRFSSLFVLEQAGKNKQGSIRWKCVCDCGKECVVSGANLRRGFTKSCGCLKSTAPKLRKKLNLVGKVFNRLTVVSRAFVKKKHVYWECLCSCGNVSLVTTDHLISGHTTSCGCYNKELMSEIMSSNVGSKH